MSAGAETVRAGRSPGPTYNDILATDTHTVPEHFIRESPGEFGTSEIPVTRYTSRDYHEDGEGALVAQVLAGGLPRGAHPGGGRHPRLRDLRHVVPRRADKLSPTWIQAFWNVCLTMPAGNCCPIPVGSRSCVARSTGSLGISTGRWRSCRHRGTSPRSNVTSSGFPRSESTRGQGSCSSIPILNPNRCSSTSARSSITSSRGDCRIASSRLTSPRSTRATWEVVEDAFVESLHVGATHPQQMVRLGDTNSRHDCYEHFNRSLPPQRGAQPVARLATDSAGDARLDAGCA